MPSLERASTRHRRSPNRSPNIKKKEPQIEAPFFCAAAFNASQPHFPTAKSV